MKKTWYIAELLQELQLKDKTTREVRNNMMLVQAIDAEEAYTKSLTFGEKLHFSRRETNGTLITSRFRGLRGLNEIYDPFEDGSEIIFEQYEALSDAALEKHITDKDHLSVFNKNPDTQDYRQTSAKKWYIAELLQEFRAIDENTSLMWVNWILIQAVDAEDAYAKSVEFGQDYNQDEGTTTTWEGVPVIARFRGVHDLHEIREDLADGSTLICQSLGALSDAEIEHQTQPKGDLAVFQKRDWDDDSLP